jgi:hypothetical protein
MEIGGERSNEEEQFFQPSDVLKPQKVEKLISRKRAIRIK